MIIHSREIPARNGNEKAKVAGHKGKSYLEARKFPLVGSEKIPVGKGEENGPRFSK
jgi:hypothetical protein